MKIALFIPVYKNPQQIKHLCKYFSPDNCTIFIHIDKKSKLMVKDLRLILSDLGNVIISDKQVNITLFDFSLLKAILILLDEALFYEKKHSVQFNYFQTITAQCYPLKSYKHYIEKLTLEYPKAFIDIDFYKTPHVQLRYKKWRFWKMQNLVYSKIKIRIMRMILKIPIYLFELLLGLLIQTPIQKLRQLNLVPVGGSPWWILPDVIIHHIANVYRESDLYKIIKDTPLSEESFFQMFYVNSPFYTGPKDDNTESMHDLLTYCHFVKGNIYSTNGHPFILEEADFDYLANSDWFFARKFDIEIDKKIIDLIDKKLLN